MITALAATTQLLAQAPPVLPGGPAPSPTPGGVQVGGPPRAPVGGGLVGPLPGGPAQCPPNTLPQYCQLQNTGTPARWPKPPGMTPYNCPLGNVQCMRQQQIMMQQARLAMAMGCPPGPGMYMCMQMRKQQQELKQKQEKNQKIMQILNAIKSAMGGGSGSQEPANGGERMAMVDGQGNVSGYGGQDVGVNGLNGNARVLEPFKRWFPQCTEKLGLGQCNFKFLGTWGDASHRARASCHNSGEAIDVGLPFTCSNGVSFDANDPRAMEVAKCMAGDTNGELQVIFRDHTGPPGMIPGYPRGSHSGHMHIQLRNCRAVRG